MGSHFGKASQKRVAYENGERCHLDDARLCRGNCFVSEQWRTCRVDMKRYETDRQTKIIMILRVFHTGSILFGDMTGVLEA